MTRAVPKEPQRGLVGALRRIPGKIWLRMAILVAILVTGFVLLRYSPLGDYLRRDQLDALVEQLRSSPASAIFLIGSYVVLAPLGMPVTPLLLAGAVVYGALLGSLYNIVGLVLGAMSAYFVGKSLGRDFIVHLAGQRLRRAERIFERRGFWPLVQIRFLPVPFPLVSYGAALAGVKASRFLITSALGLIPATVMHTYFMAKLYLAPSALTLTAYAAMWGAFNVVVGWPTLREGLRRRRRYRELKADRDHR